MELINQLKYKYKTGTLPIKLIYINTGIFVLMTIVSLISETWGIKLHAWLTIPANFQQFFEKPWVIFTYMFVHSNILHLAFNMLMMWVIGELFYKYFGNNAFANFFFIGGIFGGLFYLLITAGILHENMRLMGASAGLYSVLFALVAYQPNTEIRLMFITMPVKILYVALGFLVLGFFINMQNIGGNLSHVGGALFGYFYMKQFEKGNDFLGKIWDSIAGLFNNKKGKKTKTTRPPKDDYDYNAQKVANQQKTNAILDKISRSGYSSLTAAEKEFLFHQGKSQR